MKLTGSHEFPAPPAVVYERLLDPDRLRTCMPGCERLDQAGADRFELTFTVPIPAVKGSMEGTVELLDKEPPHAFRMKIDASGKNGFVNADAYIRVEPTGGGSTVHYDADAQIGGPAASVGQRVITGISRRQAAAMMSCLAASAVAERRPNVFVRLWRSLASVFRRNKSEA